MRFVCPSTRFGWKQDLGECVCRDEGNAGHGFCVDEWSNFIGLIGGSIECDEFSRPFEHHDMSYGTSIYLTNNRSLPILWVFGDPCIQDVSPAFLVESVDCYLVERRCASDMADPFAEQNNP